MDETFTPYDTAEYLHSEEEMTHYLDACLEEGDAGLVVHALRMIARARKLNNAEKNQATSGESVEELFSDSNNPSISAVLHAIKALGMQLHAVSCH